jgi:hypothetical protein
VPTNPYGPYHLGEQYAAALLPPIAASLEVLAEQLTQYVTRIPMSDSDRQSVAHVESIVRDAREQVARIATNAANPEEPRG